MKWYITEPAPIAEGINTVKLVQKELGSEAAGIALKWPYRPVVTRTVMVEQPVWDMILDESGDPVLNEFGEPTYQENGTETVPSEQAVAYPYIVAESNQLRAATDEERAAIDSALASQQAAALADQIARIAPTAQLFAQTLRTYFPDLDPPAEQNQAITQSAVEAYFVGLKAAGTITAQQLADAVFLDKAFSALKGADGTTWSLPWDAILAWQP